MQHYLKHLPSLCLGFSIRWLSATQKWTPCSSDSGAFCCGDIISKEQDKQKDSAIGKSISIKAKIDLKSYLMSGKIREGRSEYHCSSP